MSRARRPRRRSERTWRVFAVLVVLALLAAMVLTGALANVSPPQTSRGIQAPVVDVAYSLTGSGPSGISISTRPSSITTGY